MIHVFSLLAVMTPRRESRDDRVRRSTMSARSQFPTVRRCEMPVEFTDWNTALQKPVMTTSRMQRATIISRMVVPACALRCIGTVASVDHLGSLGRSSQVPNDAGLYRLRA